MSNWEAYALKKEYENSMFKWEFHAYIFSLILILRARGGELHDSLEFETAKSEIVNSDMINNPEYQELKQWIESNPDYDTADLQTLVDIYDKLMSKY